ncbi:Fanconi anemia group J protein homolog isoform X2 [Acanthaster planci]|nr:Fanconi anemia group J protein homolog isoform X2 [Acanthaster planci]
MATGGVGVVQGTSYTIGGVKVDFPCKAYPTQLSMMSMIIKGIERHQNCLLESPTGSGKSLALLCSCLAWQQNEYKKRNEEDLEAASCEQNDCQASFVCTCDCSKTSPQQPGKPCIETSPLNENGTAPSAAHSRGSSGTCQPSLAPSGSGCNQEENSRSLKIEVADGDDADFQPSKKRFRTSGTTGGTCKKSKGAKGVVFDDPSDDDSPEAKTHPHTKAHWQMKLNGESVGQVSAQSPCSCPCHSSKVKDPDEKQTEAYKRKKIPKIYFGTRTHKQIAQIVRELGRTAYKDVPMCILGSREYTCVHPDVSRSFNKNDGCKELLDGRNGLSCRYYNGAHKIKTQWQLRDRGLTEAWDIEELVSLGKKIKACPYFAVRSLKDEADIVFCPYNYLVDPMIRMTMDINLKNQIVILDEAHNIEDSARDAASCSVTADQMEETVAELDSHIKHQWREFHCRVMHTVSAALLDWVKSHSTNLTQRDFERALHVWSGAQIVNDVLTGLGITKDTLGTFQHHLAAVVEEAEPMKKEQENGVTLSSGAAMTLKGLFLMFGFLFKDEMKYTKDFKVAIVRTVAKTSRFQKTDNRWISKRRSSDQSWTVTLNFWCLNPAVAFSDFGEEVRSIILTSGTLSPMSSFQSELGVAFPIQLEANHVVHTSQVWVGTVAVGTNGGSLNASYKNAETYSFQDEIGLLLLQVCQVIPYGVLCFLPSYGMLNKLSQRWKNTGLWDQLGQVKVVMSEARGADKVNFDEHLREFYEVIKDCEKTDIENQSVTGAVFLAVCRGKVSEGMDFADNNARAVMTIGIPFPSIKDTQVELKRQYNDQYSTSRGLLTGSEWYEIQAYRAINQALGRCIRHKRDWGALILVDDRFGRNPKKYITGLSKWVRGKVVHHTHARGAVVSLKEFAKARQLSPCPQLPSLSLCASPSPSQSISAVVTPISQEPPAVPLTPAPPTPTPAQPLDHGDNGMSNVLKVMALHAQQSQNLTTPNLATPNLATPNLATPTPMKFFSSAATPSTPFAFGSGTLATEMPNPTLTSMSSSAFLPTQGVNTSQKLVPSSQYLTGPNNTVITLQHSPAVTPTPLQGQLVEDVDKSGKKVIEHLLNQMPVSNLLQKAPPVTIVVSSTASAVFTPSVASTLATKGDIPTKSNQAERLGSRRFTIPLPGDDSVKENIRDFENCNKSNQENLIAPSLQSENVPLQNEERCFSPESVVPHGVTDVRTPRGRLDFGEGVSDLPSGRGVDNEEVDPSKVVSPTEDQPCHMEPSSADPVHQMEAYREEYDATPLLFDSDDDCVEEKSPCPKVTNRGPQNVHSGSAKGEHETDFKENSDDFSATQPLKQDIQMANQKSLDANLPTPYSKVIANCSHNSSKKEDVSVNTRQRDLKGGGTRSRGQMSLRRSSRRRKRSQEAQSQVDEAGPGGRDFLDDITPAGRTQTQEAGASLCRCGLFCATCNCCFTENVDEVSLVSEAETVKGYSYLAGQAKLTDSRMRKLGREGGRFCQCQEAVRSGEGQRNLSWADAGLYRVSANGLRNVSTQMENSLGSLRDFALNAHWSEKDQCCYQPITCTVCHTKRNVTPAVIGCKLVAVGQRHDNRFSLGQVWLFPKDVTHCQRFTPKE